ncbi:MAG: MFS transporter, partial [Rhizobiales bacterium]|nr:MFS transporter [Hyphomicrobiales bacterium]
AATTLLFELPLGSLADGIGRKPVYLGSVIVTLIAITGLLLFKSFIVIAIGFGLMGLGRALMSGTLDAWFIEKFRQQAAEYSSQPALAYVEMSGGIGLAVFAVCGGLLTDLAGPFLKPIGLGVYDAPLIASIVLTIILFIYTKFAIIEKNRPINKQAVKSGFSNIGTIIHDSGFYAFKHKIISVMLLSTAITSLAFIVLETFWIPYVKPMIEGEYVTSIIGVLTFIYFFSMAIGAGISTPIVNLFNGSRAHALLLIICLSGLLLCLLSFTNTLYYFIPVIILVTVLMGAASPPFASIFHDYIPDNKRSTLLSLQSLVEKIGGLIGMLGLGYIAEKFGIGTAWQFGGGVVIIAGLLYLFLANRTATAPIIKPTDGV